MAAGVVQVGAKAVAALIARAAARRRERPGSRRVPAVMAAAKMVKWFGRWIYGRNPLAS